MTETWTDIGHERSDFWDEDNLSLSLFVYKVGREDSRVNRFIPGFKAGEGVVETGAQIYNALKKFADDWNRDGNCKYVVPIPSHTARHVSPSSRLMCLFIAGQFGLQFPEGLLFRKKTTPPSHLAYSGERLTAQEHFESLGCGSANLNGATVLLFDDVRTTGITSQARRWRLKSDVNAGEVVRLFLARTEP